jgi:phosphatidylglycerophosphate synthase
MSSTRQAPLEVRLYRGFRRLRDLALTPGAALLTRLGVAPWAVSLLGVAAALCTFFIPAERNGLAFAALAAAVAADALDGAVARRAGRCSGAGKLLDQVCDAATFATLALAAAARGFAPWSLALAAAIACTLATAAALRGSARRDPEAFRADPRAGFWGHLPKLPFAAAYPLALLGGAAGVALVPPALLLSAVAGALVTATQALKAAVTPALGETA